MKIVSFIQHFVFVNFNLIVRETGCDIQMGDETFCLVPRRLSLSMKICAQRKAGRRKRASTSLVSPSHGPLRFATSHWRFPFSSMWNKYSLSVLLWLLARAKDHIMTCWPELNHRNAFVKIATDALMLCIKSWKNVLKRFSARWYNQ